MSEPIHIRNLTRTCIACPSQWQAEDADGKFVYVRYRWGYLRVERAASEADWWAQEGVEQLYGAQVGDALDGSMTTSVMLQTAGLRLVASGLLSDERDAG